MYFLQEVIHKATTRAFDLSINDPQEAAYVELFHFGLQPGRNWFTWVNFQTHGVVNKGFGWLTQFD